MNIENDMTDGFTAIKAARALIVDANKSVSDATAKQYTSAFSRMDMQNKLPEKIANTVRSFYFYRAAWVFNYVSTIKDILKCADKAQREKDFPTWNDLVDRLPKLIQKLELYRPDPNSKHLEKGLIGKWSVELEKRLTTGVTISSHSKRNRLRALPADWRTLMFDGIKASSKYKDVIAVLSATGARPSEFENGIRVMRDSTESLRFTILGTKTHGGKYGQIERSFSVRIDRPELAYLSNKIQNTDETLVIKASAGALSDKVRQLSDKVFPRLRSSVSAYVFRHQLAADLKASGLPDEDVSAALGHSVDETKRFYSAAQSAREPGGIMSIQATRPVRMKTREKIKNLDHVRHIDYQLGLG